MHFPANAQPPSKPKWELHGGDARISSDLLCWNGLRAPDGPEQRSLSSAHEAGLDEYDEPPLPELRLDDDDEYELPSCDDDAE